MTQAITRISEAMKQLGIESIRYSPPTDLIPRDTFTVRLLDGWLGEHIGCGDTVSEAFEDAARKVRREAA